MAIPSQGVLAMSCYATALSRNTVPLEAAPGYVILLWNFRDPLHPENVLESPVELAGGFVINPASPTIVAAGCVTGQIVIWDIQDQEVRPRQIVRLFIWYPLIASRAWPGRNVARNIVICSRVLACYRREAKIRWARELRKHELDPPLLSQDDV